MLQNDLIMRQISRLVEGIARAKTGKKQDPITFATTLGDLIEDLFGLTYELCRRLSASSLRGLMTDRGPYAPVALGVLLCQSDDERDQEKGRALIDGADLDELPEELAALLPRGYA